MNITQEEYEEYKTLKKWANKEKVFESVKSIKRLEDDVDKPIRKCVAMLALLRCQPTYSCCGFDYDGQPFHKSHQYGEPYIRMRSNLFSLALTSQPLRFGWIATSVVGDVTLLWKGVGNPHWRNPNCIHFSEEIVDAITWLEKCLEENSDKMMDEAILVDTNNLAKERSEYWQYPPKEDWIIRKSDIISKTPLV